MYKQRSLKDEYVIKPTLHAYKKAMDFRTHRFHYRGSRISSYDKSNINSRKKKLMVEIESNHFNPAQPISIWGFLQTFRQACDNLKIREGAAMFPFAHFMTSSAKTDLLH